MVWARSYGTVAILWFRQNVCPRPPPTPHVISSHLGQIQCTHGRLAGCPRPPGPHCMVQKAIWTKYSVYIWKVGWMSHPPTEGLQRPFGSNTVFTYGRLAGCLRPPVPPHWRASKASLCKVHLWSEHLAVTAQWLFCGSNKNFVLDPTVPLSH